MPVSRGERTLVAFLRKRGVDVRWQDEGGVPPVYNPLSGRDALLDVYLPSSNLYVEVKGQMTLDAIARVATLARSCRIYLYQHTDCHWPLELDHWGRTEITPAMKSILAEAILAREASREKRRPRKAAIETRTPTAGLAFLRCFQREELLLLAKDASLAADVSRMTHNRLSAYSQFVTERFSSLELLPGLRR